MVRNICDIWPKKCLGYTIAINNFKIICYYLRLVAKYSPKFVLLFYSTSVKGILNFEKLFLKFELFVNGIFEENLTKEESSDKNFSHTVLPECIQNKK